MRTLRVGIIIMFVIIVSISMIPAQTISLTIDSIEANRRITGYVSGLDQRYYSSYKVIIYIKTDKWYIHPYAGQGEGLSWASIQADGTWQIATIRREFTASAVAALIVRRSYREPATVEHPGLIRSRAMDIMELRGTPHYGKL